MMRILLNVKVNLGTLATSVQYFSEQTVFRLYRRLVSNKKARHRTLADKRRLHAKLNHF